MSFYVHQAKIAMLVDGIPKINVVNMERTSEELVKNIYSLFEEEKVNIRINYYIITRDIEKSFIWYKTHLMYI